MQRIALHPFIPMGTLRALRVTRFGNQLCYNVLILNFIQMESYIILSYYFIFIVSHVLLFCPF